MGTEISNMKGCLTIGRFGIFTHHSSLISAGQLASSASQPCRLPVLGGNFLSWFPLVNFIRWKVRTDSPKTAVQLQVFFMASDTLSEPHSIHVLYIYIYDHIFTSISPKCRMMMGEMRCEEWMRWMMKWWVKNGCQNYAPRHITTLMVNIPFPLILWELIWWSSCQFCCLQANDLNLVRFVTFKYFGSLGISWSSDF